MILLKNKMGMRVLTLALCAALGGSVLAVKAESVAGEIRQHNVGHGAFQRVVLCQSAVVQLRHPSVGQLVAAL